MGDHILSIGFSMGLLVAINARRLYRTMSRMVGRTLRVSRARGVPIGAPFSPQVNHGRIMGDLRTAARRERLALPAAARRGRLALPAENTEAGSCLTALTHESESSPIAVYFEEPPKKFFAKKE